MADRTPGERLQPSLLDRLTDDLPGQAAESREHRPINLAALRRAVLRDLAWLLNTTNLDTTVDLERYPLVRDSVLNYGMRSPSGLHLAGADTHALLQAVRSSVLRFEPRLSADSLRVTLGSGEDSDVHGGLEFVIEGELWAHPAPVSLAIRTRIDLEVDDVQLLRGSARTESA